MDGRTVAGAVRSVHARSPKGHVIALDEAEAIPTIGGTAVASGYSNLAALIEAAERIEDIYFIYAATPTFFDDVRRHAQSVARRVSKDTRMDLTPLSESDFTELAEKIAGLVAIANDGDVDEAQLVTTAREIAARLSGARAGSVRDFLTTLFAAMNAS